MIKLRQLSLLFALFAVSGCGSEFRSETGALYLYESSSTQMDGAKLYKTNCSSCHGSLATTEKKGASAQEIDYAIANITSMRFLGRLTSEETRVIASALSVSKGSLPSLPATKISGYETGLANAKILRSHLESIFYNSQSPNYIDDRIRRDLRLQISDQPDTFGGTCSRYDSNCSPGANAKGAPMVSSASPVRKGRMKRACQKILSYDQAVDTALKNTNLVPGQPISDGALATIYSAFNAGRQANTEDIEILTSLAISLQSQGFNITKQWKYVLYSLCTSHGTEML